MKRKNFWIKRLETFYTQGRNHELNKIRHWSCLYFTIQNQFVWGSSSVKNWKMASTSWKIYLVSNKFVEFRTWKVLLKNTTTNMCWKTLFFTSSAPLASLLLYSIYIYIYIHKIYIIDKYNWYIYIYIYVYICIYINIYIYIYIYILSGFSFRVIHNSHDGRGERGYFFCSSLHLLPLRRRLDISWEITVESSPLT